MAAGGMSENAPWTSSYAVEAQTFLITALIKREPSLLLKVNFKLE